MQVRLRQGKTQSQSRPTDIYHDQDVEENESTKISHKEWVALKRQEKKLRGRLIQEALQKQEEAKFEKQLVKQEKEEVSNQKVQEWFVNKKREMLQARYKEFFE